MQRFPRVGRVGLITGVLGAVGCAVPLSRATSPNGMWTTEVRGTPMLFGLGGIEVTMRSKGPNGATRSEGVIDLCSSWIEAKRKYATIDLSNERAVVDGRVTRFDEGERAGVPTTALRP